MQLEVGQIYVSLHRRQEYVLVFEVRDEQHPRGLGEPYGDTGLAIPIDPTRAIVDLDDAHPFNVCILNDVQPSHGDARWELVPDTRYLVRADGLWHAQAVLGASRV